MVRPLGIWIAGILLAPVLGAGAANLAVLLLPAVVLFVSFLYRAGNSDGCYPSRWIWGMVFFSILLFLSIQFTHWREQYEPGEISLVRETALGIRDQWVDSFDRLDLTEDEKMVLATVTLGYRQHLSVQAKRAFRVTGSAHILAVSGMHVGIVCGFLTFLFSCFGGYGRRSRIVLLFQLLFLWGYVFMTGCAASAVRAGWMLSFYLIGTNLVKITDSYNTLAAAAFCMLAYNPFYLFDIGFQLSCLAVFFILYLTPLFTSLFPLRNPLLSVPVGWLAMACSAQVGLTLLCLWYFKSVTFLFLFTTIPVMAMVVCLMPLTLIWLLLPSWVPGGWLLQGVIEKLTHWFYQTICRFSEIEGMDISFSLSGWQLLSGYVLLVISIEYLRIPKKNSIKSDTFELFN